jgi:hypothetical protein
MQQPISATQAYNDFYRTQYDILASRQLAIGPSTSSTSRMIPG